MQGSSDPSSSSNLSQTSSDVDQSLDKNLMKKPAKSVRFREITFPYTEIMVTIFINLGAEQAAPRARRFQRPPEHLQERRHVCSPHFNFSTMKEGAKLMFKENVLEA